jgi:hypothetical protein
MELLPPEVKDAPEVLTVKVLPFAPKALGELKDCVTPMESPLYMVPDASVGVPVEETVPSYVLVEVTAL